MTKIPDQQGAITASCIITRSALYDSEKQIFTNATTGVPDFLVSAYKQLGVDYPKFYKMDNLCKLGWLASEIIMRDSGVRSKYNPEEIGVILCNANSSLDTDLRYFDTVSSFPSPALFVYTLPNIMIGEICIRHNIRGENAFFVFDHFDPNFVYHYVGNLLKNGNLKACICGWVELLGDQYKAVLFMVEQKAEGSPFTPATMNEIFSRYGQ
jgi:hypothetical protein